MIWLICEDCAWLAKLASLAQTVLGFLDFVDGTWLAQSRSPLRSLDELASLARIEIYLYLLFVRSLVCLAWAALGSLACGARFARKLGWTRLARLLLSLLRSFKQYLVGLANKKILNHIKKKILKSEKISPKSPISWCEVSKITSSMIY